MKKNKTKFYAYLAATIGCVVVGLLVACKSLVISSVFLVAAIVFSLFAHKHDPLPEYTGL